MLNSWIGVLLVCWTRGSRGGQTVYSRSDEGLYHFPAVKEYPYVAALTSKLGVCTGVIVDKEWLLTAAHCVYNGENNEVLANDGVEVVAGSTDYLYMEPGKEKAQRTTSKDIKVHPWFWYGRLGKYDVALVRVRDPFVFTPYVNATRLVFGEWPQHPDQTHKCSTLGYGGYWSSSTATSTLKRRTINATHGDKACPCAFRFQDKRLVCIREKRYSLMCAGDDGGPLLCQDKVVAVAHMVWNRDFCTNDFAYPTDRCLKNPEPATTSYYYLCPLGDWLHSVVPAIPATPAQCDASRVALCLGLLLLPIVLITT